MIKSISKIAVLLVAFCFVSPPVNAKPSVTQLKKEIEELKRVNQAQAKNLAHALNQIQQVLTEFQKVHGQVDQSLHQGSQLAGRVKDTEQRLKLIEDQNQVLVTQLEELKRAGLLPPDHIKRLNSFRHFQKGLTKINGKDYQGAIKTLKDFLAKNKKDPYAVNAQYWIAECYFALRDYTKAVSEFQKVIKKHPKSHQAPPALLKQGYSFFEMQSFEDSKAFLSKLIKTYPTSIEADQAKARIKDIDKLLDLRKKEALIRQSIM